MSESRAKRQHVDVEAAEPENGPKLRLQKRNLMDRIQILAEKVMHLTPTAAQTSSIEYYRFMALKAAFDNDGIPSKLAPPDQVDELWHAHLLDTRSYTALESLLLPNGGKIHHNPVHDEQPNYPQRLEHTRNLYFDTYHTAPPFDIWGDQSDVEVVIIQEKERKEKVKVMVTITLCYSDSESQNEVKLHISRYADGIALHNACFEATNGVYERFEDYRLLYDGITVRRDIMKLEIEEGDRIHMMKNLRGC